MLRQLILSRQIAEARSAMEAAEEENKALMERREAMNQREADIVAAVNEVTEETTAEEKATVDALAEEWKADDEKLVAEEKENADKRTDLQANIEKLTAELDALNERAKPEPKKPEERKEDVHMNTRKFFSMSAEQRDAFFKNENVVDFLHNVRSAYTEKRSIGNVGLLVPEIMLPIIRQVTEEASKLMKHVNAMYVPGNGRQNVMGNIPEAVWTEMCAKLNELNLSFNNVELDGYKVGGFIAVCNAMLEDADDVALATEVLNAIGKAIGLALDKAILFGTGTKMPVGIYTRLAQTAKPDDYPETARPWVDLHTSNIVSIASSKEGAALYKEIVKASGKTRNSYATGARFWAMNETTYTNLLAEALSFNASGAIVTGQSMTMPVVGGAIEILDFMPDNLIIGGYGENYALAERAGTNLATSEHYRFVEDQTVFRGTARYDGKPVIAESFIAIGLGGTTVATAAATVTFVPDTANAAG